MLNKNITKITLFVILAFFWSASVTGCGSLGPDGTAQAQETADFGPPARGGVLRSPDLKEASGIAASKCQPDVYWTHNDSGDDAFLYAINGTGASLGVWRVAGAKNRDWEDIAEFKDPDGRCYVLIGDIGDNDLKRESLSVYKVAEPKVDDASRASNKANPVETAVAETISFHYPDGRHNAEALMVHPSSGDIYVLTKSKKEPVSVYKLTQRFGPNIQTVSKVAQFTVPAVPNGLITGGDISPDGKNVVICDYVYGYELKLPAFSANFDDIWKQPPLRFDLGDRPVGEAVGYLPAGDSVIAVSEEPNSPIYIVKRK